MTMQTLLRKADIALKRLAVRRERKARQKQRIGWWSDTMDRWAADEHYSAPHWR